MRLPSWVAWICAAGLAGIFLYSSSTKIMDPAQFAQEITNYRLVPLWAVNGLAVILPAWELLAGVAVLIPPLRRAGALIVLILAFGFITAVASAMIRGLDIRCGCFGTRSGEAGVHTLVLDGLMVIAALVLIKTTPAEVACIPKS